MILVDSVRCTLDMMFGSWKIIIIGKPFVQEVLEIALLLQFVIQS